MKRWFRKLTIAEKLVMAIIIIASLTSLPSTALAQDSTGWSTPNEIAIAFCHDGIYVEEPSIAVDPEGNWHIIYVKGVDDIPYCDWHEDYLIYINSISNDPETIVQTRAYRTETGWYNEYLSDPSIAVDPNGGVQVVFKLFEGEYNPPSDTRTSAIMYMNKPGRPVILIHGFNGNNDSWGGSDPPNLKSLLEENGRIVKYFSYSSPSPSISVLASHLDDSLTVWNDSFQIDELGVDIIAHSMGGLISRYYIAHPGEFSFASKVEKLVTLGTPNYGAAVALWGDWVPGTIQATQMKFGSQFLWDLHEAWKGSSFETDVLCIVGAKDNYGVPHDGVVLLPSANIENLGYPVCYIPNSHGGVGGMAYIEDVNHPSYVAIKSFLSGEIPQSNKESVSHLTEGMLIVGLFDPSGNPVSVGTFPLTGLPRVWWDPNPTLYWSWPWWPWLSSFGYGVNPSSGKYYATGADTGSYQIVIYPSGGYSPIIDYPFAIEPRQTKVLSLTVYPADESATETIASGDIAPEMFGNTGVTMDFSSGPAGEVSVYRFNDNPPATDCVTLPHYWDIISDMPEYSFSVSVTFDYIESEVSDAGLSEKDLIVAYYDGLWYPMNTTVDSVNNTVSVTTSHFTLFSVGHFKPSSFALSQNYPNPMMSSTTFSFSIPFQHAKDAKIEVYNIKGQLVKTLTIIPINRDNKFQITNVTWDGTDKKKNLYHQVFTSIDWKQKIINLRLRSYFFYDSFLEN